MSPVEPEKRGRQVSVSRVIDATADEIFDVLADPSKHSLIDGSGTVKASRGHSQRLALGSKFGMSMRMGVPYVIRNTVVEFEEDRLIAWRHFWGHRWRYELVPLDDGRTKVIETFDWSTAFLSPTIEWVGYPERHPPNMARTLERLDHYLTSEAS
jgi:uncharacterized protein YndB with AHSA1/START domain